MIFEFDQMGVEIAPGVEAGSFDGRAEITFEEHPGDFYVEWIEVDGLMLGGVRQTVRLNVKSTLNIPRTFPEHLCVALENTLMLERKGDIIEQGSAKSAFRWPRESDEHRLSARQLGIDRVAL